MAKHNLTESEIAFKTLLAMVECESIYALVKRANEMGIKLSKSGLYKIQKGETESPNAKTLEKLSRVLDIDVDTIMTILGYKTENYASHPKKKSIKILKRTFNLKAEPFLITASCILFFLAGLGSGRILNLIPHSNAPSYSSYPQQGEIVKNRIRQTVQDLHENDGPWWSPWRVLHESGTSVSGLLRGRSRSDILVVFAVDQRTIEAGLRSTRTLNYLADVGYDLREKKAEELSARETFELLEIRAIRDPDQHIYILSTLVDMFVADRIAESLLKEWRTKNPKKA